MDASRRRAARLVFLGFEGTSVPAALRRRIAGGQTAGIVLFRRNLGDVAQTRALIEELHAHAPPSAPLTIAIDEEGGRVQRLAEPWTRWPAMRQVGLADDLAATRALGEAIGRELADLRIDLDFAPVVDVDTNPANPVIGDRSFASTPEAVSRHACAFVVGLQSAGVAACAKHFPGHGDADVDSHRALPVLRHDRARLDAVELPPFRAAIGAGVASVMTAHVLLPVLDPDRPATLSRAVLSLLRETLGFDGLVFSDDLDMKAVAGRFSAREIARDALAAGVDVLLACRDPELQEQLSAALVEAPASLTAPALVRLDRFQRRFAGGTCGQGGAPPYAAHRALAARFV